MDFLSRIFKEKTWPQKTIGVEKDNYYFSAACLESLHKNLPQANFVDSTGLVNWQRTVKSPQELNYMRKAARIVEKMHARILEVMEPGMRKNDLVAEIYHSAISGVTGTSGEQGFGGDYPAIVPMTPTGADASAPHLTWDDQPIPDNSGTFFEISGCYRHYHCPLSRTVYLGKPPQKFLMWKMLFLKELKPDWKLQNPATWRKILRRPGAKRLLNMVMKKKAAAVMQSV